MAGQSALLRHPVISAACLFCLLYISCLSFAPAPFGLYNATAAAAGAFPFQAPCEIRSVPTLCVDSWYAFALLIVARLTAYGTYPLLVCLFLTKLNHLRTLLQRSWLSMYVPFHDLHAIHTLSGAAIGYAALLHSLVHLLRWGLQGRFDMVWGSASGLSGVLACLVTPFVSWPMQFAPLRARLRWELRKGLHYLSVLWGLALCFHAPQQYISFIAGIPLALYLSDWAIGTMLNTHLVESPLLSRMEKSVELTFEHPPGFRSGRGYIYVCIPWISRSEWHAFSLFAHPELPNHSSVCMSVNGDWTARVHKAVRARTVRPAWICGPFASPYSTAVHYEDLILVASGIGITPAMDIINAYRAGSRRLSLIWSCRDASLLEYYLQHGRFDKDGWTLIYYTGKRKLRLQRSSLPDTLCVFHGRPVWDTVIREIISSIELGMGLPEEVVAEREACLDDLLQARQELELSGASTPLQRFQVLLRRVLCRQSAAGVLLELRQIADLDEVDMEAFSYLVHHMMPSEFSAEEEAELFSALAAGELSARDSVAGQPIEEVVGSPPAALKGLELYICGVEASLRIDLSALSRRRSLASSGYGSLSGGLETTELRGRYSSANAPAGRLSFVAPLEGDSASSSDDGLSDDGRDAVAARSRSSHVRIPIKSAATGGPPPPAVPPPPPRYGSQPLSSTSTNSSGWSSPHAASCKSSLSTADGSVRLPAVDVWAPPPRALRAVSSMRHASALRLGRGKSSRGPRRPKGGEHILPQRVSITSATTLNLGLLPGKHAEVEALLGKSRPRPQPASPGQKQQRPSPGKAPPERLSLQAQQLQKFGATPDEASQLLTSLDGVDAEALAKWQILYCGGSQPVVDELTRISGEVGVDFRIEKFDW